MNGRQSMLGAIVRKKIWYKNFSEKIICNIFKFHKFLNFLLKQELQLFNKLSLEQSIAPLRNNNFNLNGNSNDLIDGNGLTKLLNFNSNTNNLIQNNSLSKNSTNTNNINSINKK